MTGVLIVVAMTCVSGVCLALGRLRHWVLVMPGVVRMNIGATFCLLWLAIWHRRAVVAGAVFGVIAYIVRVASITSVHSYHPLERSTRALP